jgi:hypothetical protein
MSREDISANGQRGLQFGSVVHNLEPAGVLQEWARSAA